MSRTGGCSRRTPRAGNRSPPVDVESVTKGEIMRKWIGIAIVALLGAGGIVALFSNGRASDSSGEQGAKASSGATAADSAARHGSFAQGTADVAQPGGVASSAVGTPAGGNVAP